ncbi:hypothetical protein M501DRAFT_1030637 [Patellaria atrata CBS 101060]|uniref:RBR-type E3 ubiquitin transferase n=1 Tax=Patellaria atrata CBS 101060 TaxID=1346257 RepID=A0A9P4SD69_9PEZI|nr:hypothetical protein M501DRAFT_1030637 [Patellaria atrata CBS 101060]
MDMEFESLLDAYFNFTKSCSDETLKSVRKPAITNTFIIAPVSLITKSPNTREALRQLECTVCTEEKLCLDFPFRNTISCRHDSTPCRSCLSVWIPRALETETWDNIRCPDTDCNAVFQYDDFSKHASESDFERVSDLSVRSALSEVPNFRWCQAMGCKSGQKHAYGTNEPIFTCTHANETCEEYDEKLRKDFQRKEEKRRKKKQLEEENKASEKTVKESSKICPEPGCGYRIQKNGGCDHMACRRGHEFCWDCLRPYKSIRHYGNHWHLKGSTARANRNSANPAELPLAPGGC